jgi:hypothetical protein
MPRISTSPTLALLALLFLLTGCTRVVTVQTPADVPPAGSLGAARDADAWWSVDFTLNWVPDQEPDWYLDALLADQVCAPALVDLGPQIGLWRFHRRAADDGVGHRFSLLIYTDPLTAEALYARVRELSLLQWLESDGRLDAVSFSRMERPDVPPIAVSSDAAWPPEIQASWPWFIMGVSQTWLSLIRQVTAQQPLDDPSPDALLDYYRSVNNQVNILWRVYGQHAYLHHLNALFGYQTLVIQETNLKRF